MTKYLCFRTLYILFCVKLISWGAGLIAGLSVPTLSGAVPPIPDFFHTEYIQIFWGIAGLINLRYNKYWLYTLVTLEMMFAWTYALFQFGVTNVSFARTIPELVLIYLMAVVVQLRGGLPAK